MHYWIVDSIASPQRRMQTLGCYRWLMPCVWKALIIDCDNFIDRRALFLDMIIVRSVLYDKGRHSSVRVCSIGLLLVAKRNP